MKIILILASNGLNKILHVLDSIVEEQDCFEQGVFKILKCELSSNTDVLSFYETVRGIVVESLGKRGDYVDWKQETLTEDEEMTVTHEDTILLLVLSLLHPKLPLFIKSSYSDRIKGKKRIKNLLPEILRDADIFLSNSSNLSNEEECFLSEQDNDKKVNYPFFQLNT